MGITVGDIFERVNPAFISVEYQYLVVKTITDKSVYVDNKFKFKQRDKEEVIHSQVIKLETFTKSVLDNTAEWKKTKEPEWE
jgi:hypothetical protein